MMTRRPIATLADDRPCHSGLRDAYDCDCFGGAGTDLSGECLS